jgi:Tfp pilus assembly protein PilF
MIYVIILILIVALVFLFVDWNKLLGNRGSQKGFKIKFKFKKINLSKKNKASEIFSEEPSLEGWTEKIDDPNYDSTPDTYKLSSDLEKMLSEADIHFRKGELKAAEQLYLKAAAADPRCSKAYGRLGIIYLESGENYDDAEAAFRQALKYDKQNGFILNNLGLVLYHMDRYADAVRQFEQAVRLDDLNAARHANLGMAYMAMRQYAKAESSFKKALKLAPQEMEYKDLLNESIEKKKAHNTMLRR